MTEENFLFSIGDRQYDADAAKTKIENADGHTNIPGTDIAFTVRR